MDCNNNTAILIAELCGGGGEGGAWWGRGMAHLLGYELCLFGKQLGGEGCQLLLGHAQLLLQLLVLGGHLHRSRQASRLGPNPEVGEAPMQPGQHQGGL